MKAASGGVIFMMICLLLGCDNDNSIKRTEERAPDSDTKRMIELVDKAINRHPHYVYLHANTARAEFAKKRLHGLTGIEAFKAEFSMAHELHLAGKTDSAIAILERLCARVDNNSGNMTAKNRAVCDILAVAYLRLGEEQNCCANHNDESCLFPLQGKAIHTRTEGSEKAIALYEEILSRFPDDIQSRYLLNIAYMTLGQYPESVPEEWLIPDLDKPSEVSFPRFTDVAIESGTDIVGLSGGTCMEDLNGDGFLDLMCSSYGLNDQLRYLESNGNGTFIDRTAQAGLPGIVSGLNMVHADYDNDGDNDVLLLRGAWLKDFGNHPNSLLRNNGDGTFDDVTISAGLFSEHPTQTACWADFNNDGWLDLFIGNENERGEGGSHPSELYMNDGDGTFTEMASVAGVRSMVYAKGCAASDINNDGLMDLFVSNLHGNNLLYINDGIDENGTPHFTDIADKAGVLDPQESFPCWFFDYDNDGFQDLFVADYDLNGFTDMAGEFALELLGGQSTVNKPKLYRNNGNGTFNDVTKDAGLERAMFAMGSNFGDLNNDGYLDFYIGNGAPDLRMIIPNLMFLNDRGERFIDVTTNGRFGNLQKGHGIAFGDVDNDGDQDIYAVMGGAVEGDTYQNLLFQNPGWENKWVQLDLVGRTSNRSAIGARVEITVSSSDGSSTFYRQVGTGGSFGSSSLRLEVGIGKCKTIESVKVIWPNGSGKAEAFTGLQLNKLYQIKEGTGKATELPLKKVKL